MRFLEIGISEQYSNLANAQLDRKLIHEGYSVKEIKQDILTVAEGVIVHQVNALGAMGAGLARDIRIRWPRVYEDYIALARAGGLFLGHVIETTVKESPSLVVCSLVGQEDYGFEKRRYTSYSAVQTGLSIIAASFDTHKVPVYIPYGMGAGLGGGDWNVIRFIINETIPDAIICRKG